MMRFNSVLEALEYVMDHGGRVRNVTQIYFRKPPGLKVWGVLDWLTQKGVYSVHV